MSACPAYHAHPRSLHQHLHNGHVALEYILTAPLRLVGYSSSVNYREDRACMELHFFDITYMLLFLAVVTVAAGIFVRVTGLE